MKRSARLVTSLVLCFLGCGAVLAWGFWPGLLEGADKKGPDPAALERARESVKMLDDLYKLTVVSITDKYVGEQSSTPAAAIAKDVFEGMHKKGWHLARLIDATGTPKDRDNLPSTSFEKKAIAALQAGKKSYEEVGEKDGKYVLRSAAVVPAVMKQCAACHHVKEGALLGAIVYEVPVK